MERNGRGMQNFTRTGLYRGGQGSGRTVGVYSHLYNMVETLSRLGAVFQQMVLGISLKLMEKYHHI